MRKWISSLLLLVLLLQAGGMFFICRLKQEHIRFYMERFLESEEANFETLLLTKTEYRNCLVEEDEIFYMNSMYDIKSLIVDGDKVHIIAVNDTNETGILDIIKKIAGASGHNNQQLPKPLQQLMTLLFMAPSPLQLNCSRNAEPFHFQPLYNFETLQYSEITTPPPQFS